MVDRELEVDVWKSDWSLASADFGCLQVMALMKFCNINAKFNVTNNPFKSPSGHLPVFRCYSKEITDYQEIVSYLINGGRMIDHFLQPKDLSEVVAYETMLRDKLYPALMYTCWVDNKNYVTVIRPWYAKALPFPLNYYYPGHYKRKYTNFVQSLYPNLKQKQIEQELYKEAEACLQCISNRLSDSEFFFGNVPSSLDAFVYGYLATLLKTPVPNSRLHDVLNSYQNLLRYVVRINLKYFNQELEEYETKKQKESSNRPTDSASDLAFPNRTRDQILAALIAIIAMTSYGVMKGIFSISFNSKDDYNLFELEEDMHNEED